MILSVEERTRDSQGLSALESSGGLANGGVGEMTSKRLGAVQYKPLTVCCGEVCAWRLVKGIFVVLVQGLMF